MIDSKKIDQIFEELRKKIDVLLKERGEEIQDKLDDLIKVSNYANAIPYNILSDSFKKSIDSIEDNLNKPPAFNVVNSEMTEESIRDFIELIEPEKQ
jgi:hypothetical protein|tara:strand:- start:215 stop:505 length:291 start_codon:yes stop_codon:yes gene_type:complete